MPIFFFIINFYLEPLIKGELNHAVPLIKLGFAISASILSALRCCIDCHVIYNRHLLIHLEYLESSTSMTDKIFHL